MDVDAFWALIDASTRSTGRRSDPVAAVEEQAERLRQLLRELPDDGLRAYRSWVARQTARANDWRVWAAGYLATGGMSDDAFEYFRLWLVHRGRDAFERVLTDPDSLADLTWDDDGEAFDAAEALAYVVDELFDERGSDPGDLVPVVPAGEPSGQRFAEEDDDGFATTFPRLAARTSAAASAEPPSVDMHGTSDEDPVSSVGETRAMRSPRPFAPMPPAVAAALFLDGLLRGEDRPMLAAHWLAEGMDGEALRELAGLSGSEYEVGDLWPAALEDAGVTLPAGGARVTAAWAAQRVLDGTEDLRWLVRVLWPPRRDDPEDQDPALDTLIYTIDDWLDWMDPRLHGRRSDAERQRIGSARAALDAAVEALARDDVPGAARALAEDQDP